MSPSKTTAASLARVDEIMSTPVLTVEASASMWDAWQLLFVSGLRYLVVLDFGETTLGVISHRTVLNQIQRPLSTFRAGPCTTSSCDSPI